MTPFAQLEKSAYRGRAFAQGGTEAIEVIRSMLTGGGKFGQKAVGKLQDLADKIPGKPLNGDVFDPMTQSAAKWRNAGAGATGGAIGGGLGVGLSKALRELGVYKTLGIEKDPAQKK